MTAPSFRSRAAPWGRKFGGVAMRGAERRWRSTILRKPTFSEKTGLTVTTLLELWNPRLAGGFSIGLMIRNRFGKNSVSVAAALNIANYGRQRFPWVPVLFVGFVPVPPYWRDQSSTVAP